MAVLPAEKFQLILLGEPTVGFPQHCQTVVVLGAKIHTGVLLTPGNVLQLLGLQQTLLHQLVQVDQVGVSGIGGIGLIGGITVTGGSQRQDLPIVLACRFQKIHKTECFLTHTANTVGTGQGSNMHQYSAFTHRKLSFFGRFLLQGMPATNTHTWYRILCISFFVKQNRPQRKFLYFPAKTGESCPNFWVTSQIKIRNGNFRFPICRLRDNPQFARSAGK